MSTVVSNADDNPSIIRNQFLLLKSCDSNYKVLLNQKTTSGQRTRIDIDYFTTIQKNYLHKLFTDIYYLIQFSSHVDDIHLVPKQDITFEHIETIKNICFNRLDSFESHTTHFERLYMESIANNDYQSVTYSLDGQLTLYKCKYDIFTSLLLKILYENKILMQRFENRLKNTP
tara:strand:+ start:231 stop:749 length:519 start_codon:yes stop_codon:yes gene_type:complete